MNQTAKQQTSVSESFAINRRIGSTTYRVGIHFNPQAKETINDKVLRLIRNDLNPTAKNVTIDLPQTGWLSERSSV